MSTHINSWRALFGEKPRILLENSDLTVTPFRCDSGVEGLKIASSRGHSTILPWIGQMIWDVQFDGHGLTMCNMFRQLKPMTEVIETYGCLISHPGLLANGCPPAEDTRLLYGEMACAAMDEAWLELDGDMLRLNGRYEYIMGLGYHYLVQSVMVLHKSSTLFDIKVAVTNLASVDMSLQYMRHMNYAYIPNAIFSQNIPGKILRLREPVSSHVNSTVQWLTFNQRIMQGEAFLSTLSQSEFYGPEIVFFADKLDAYTDQPEFRMIPPDGTTSVTRFYSAEPNYAIRWIPYSGEQQVVVFVLPVTRRPEGYLAAQRNDTLIQVTPQQTRTFTVTTGVE